MTDLSVTQYNPYNMYQNFGYYPAFRGETIQQNNYLGSGLALKNLISSQKKEQKAVLKII